MITTTLKQLRQHKACFEGYNKLVCSLQGKEFTDEIADRDTYIRYHYDANIPLAYILNSNGFDDALWALRACEQTPEMMQAERLYAVWCARQVQHLMTNQRSINALDVAERYANGLATDEELTAASDTVWATSDAAWDAASNAVSYAASYAASDTASNAVRDIQRQMFVKVFCGESLSLKALLQK